MVAIAAVRFLVAMVLYLAGQPTAIDLPLPPWAYAVFAAGFATVGGLLVTTNRHDARGAWLGGMFLLLTTPTSPTTLGSTAMTAWLVDVRPDSLLPFFFWQFVSVFPSRLDRGMSAMLARAAAFVAGIGGVLAFLVNATFAAWPVTDPESDPRLLLAAGPRVAQSWFWLSVFVPMLGAFAFLVWRAFSGEAADRQRVRFFVAALFSGLVPFAVQVSIELLSPAYRAFSHSAAVEPLLGAVLFGFLATLPLSTAYSVLFDRIVELRFVLRLTYQYLLARYSLAAFTLTPFVALAFFVWQRRADPVASFFVGWRPYALATGTALGIAALKMRGYWLARLDNRYWRQPYDTRDVLSRLVSGFHIESREELTALIQRELDTALHARVEMFYEDDTHASLQHSENKYTPLSTQSALAALVMSDTRAMEVDLSTQSALTRLPAAELEWLRQGDFRWLVGLRTPGGRCAGLIVLSAKRSEAPYTDQDRTLISTIASAAGLAVDNLRLRSSRTNAPELPAGECVQCGRIVEAVLQRCPHCGGNVGRSQVPVVLRGTYRLVERIGAGGMGIVYRANDLLLQREVAIKTLPAVTPENIKRLKDEARAMAAVSHPNLAVVYGIEIWNEKPLLVVEYLPGGTLRDRLARRPLSAVEAIDVGITLAEVLDELHKSGILHCDVKPSNIGFTKSGALKLLDFGLARLFRVIDPAAVTMTLGRDQKPDQTGLSEHGIAGTPYYMCPEAIGGARATEAFDLWAVAVVVYEVLTGRRPFDGRDVHQVYEKVATAEFAPIADSVVSQAAPINDWLGRQLSRDRSLRIADAASLASSLRVLRSAIS